MASESDAKMPGASSAASPEMTMLATIATHNAGASANAIHAPAMPMATNDSSREPEPRVLQHQARRERDPDA